MSFNSVITMERLMQVMVARVPESEEIVYPPELDRASSCTKVCKYMNFDGL